MTPSSDHQAHVAPAEPHPIKQTLWQRWMAWSGSFLILSIIVHFLLIGGGAVLVVQVVQGRKEKLKFTAPPPSPAGAVEHKVKASKKTAAAAPDITKRIVSTAANASISLPAMEMNSSSGPDVMASVMSGMGGSGLGAGMGASGGAGMASMPLGGLTAFGFKGKSKIGLTGYYYDLKLKADGKTPTEMTYSATEQAAKDNFDLNWSKDKGSKATKLYIEVMKNVAKSWDDKVLEEYFKAPDPMTAFQILIPPCKASEAPKAFGVENISKPSRWMIHYKGSFTAPKDGEFRFIGKGDDVLVVALNGKVVLDASLGLHTLDGQKRDKELGVMIGTPPNVMQQGAWFVLSRGEKVTMDILIGEGPGGMFSQFLGIEDKSAPNPPNDCPAFQLQDVPLPTFKPNERGWNDRAPKNFSGKKTIFKG